MSQTKPSARARRLSNVSVALAADRLGVPSVVFFVMSAATPLTVVSGIIPTGYAVTSVTALPIAFLLIGALLALFCVGYVSMAKKVANAGAFYTYIAKGIGRPVGVAAAWVALVGYNALQVGLYGFIGAAAAPVLNLLFGIELYWWVTALCAWLIVAILGQLHVDINGKVLAVLLVAEAAVIVAYSLSDLAHPAGGTISFDTLSPAGLAVEGVGAALAIAVLGFVGFEQTVVFAEEARDPQRTVRVASYVSVGVIAALYAVGSWAMSVATGPGQIVAQTQEQGPELIFGLAGDQLGGLAVTIGRALLVTSVLAAMISFHNTSARYAFALGRERVLPERLGRTSPRTGSPRLGSAIQSVVGLAVIALYAVNDWEPVTHLFFWGGTAGALGVLALIATTAVAVIVYFARHPDEDNLWRRLIAPVISALGLVTVLVLVMINFDVLLGVEPTSPLRWAIPAIYVVIILAGAIWALLLYLSRPDVYRGIGLGAKSATAGTATPDVVPERPDFDWTQERP
jgi:amino acid transporter